MPTAVATWRKVRSRPIFSLNASSVAAAFRLLYGGFTLRCGLPTLSADSFDAVAQRLVTCSSWQASPQKPSPLAC